MQEIFESDKHKIIDFLKESDYQIVDNGFSRFHIMSYDNIKFSFCINDGNYIIVKYDKAKDIKGGIPFEYFTFKTLIQVLEQLKAYDELIYKEYWKTIPTAIEISIDNDREEDWYKKFISDEFFTIDDNTLVYNNPNYNPELSSPYNTIHLVSALNKEKSYTKVNKLYFEINPLKNEKYLLRLLCNNDETFKEYINYIVDRDKGLKLLILTLLKDLERFKYQ